MPRAELSFDAIGTRWRLSTAHAVGKAERAQIDELIAGFDMAYSRFRSDSLVSQARRGASAWDFPPSIVPLLERYSRLHTLTRGAINPLVGESLEALGYDADYSLQPGSPRPAPPLDTLTLDGQQLTFRAPALLDIGAIGKGLLVDEVARIVEKSHTEYTIDASGDIRVASSTTEVIGLEDPRDPSRVIGEVRLTRGSLCASATNRRAWGHGLHHIIDARTGRPATYVTATWATSRACVDADMLSAALFFATPADIDASYPDAEYVILYADGRVVARLENGTLYR